MNLRMSHLAAGLMVVYLMHASAQEVLPSRNKELSNDYKLALDAIFGIGIRLQAFLNDDEKENFLVSPISTAVVVGQLILGAEGEFRKQLVDLLSLPNSHLYENDRFYSGKNKNVTHRLPYSTLHIQLSNLLTALEHSPKEHFTLKQNSAVFVNDRITLQKKFQRYLKRFYKVNVRQMDFVGDPLGTQKFINKWADDNTNGLITSILAQPPSPSTVSIFANAVYFFAEWEMPFSDILTKPGLFNSTATKQVNVSYMAGYLEQIPYSESPNYRMIVLPYKNEELGMYIILPKPDNPYKYDMKNFIRSVESSEILETISKAQLHDVIVKMPKMSVSNTFSLLDQLKKYSVFKKEIPNENVMSNRSNPGDVIKDRVDVFNNFTAPVEDDIYLTAAADGKTFRIDDIVQQVVVTVNEKGTEAGVVTASTINYMGGLKNFLIERPFVFFIRHQATSATLFWGTISNPAP